MRRTKRRNNRALTQSSQSVTCFFISHGFTVQYYSATCTSSVTPRVDIRYDLETAEPASNQPVQPRRSHDSLDDIMNEEDSKDAPKRLSQHAAAFHRVLGTSNKIVSFDNLHHKLKGQSATKTEQHVTPSVTLPPLDRGGRPVVGCGGGGGGGGGGRVAALNIQNTKQK